MRLLIVDDSRNDRILAIREIRKDFPAAQCAEVEDADALHAALDRADFDLVVTDYSLGWIDGLEVLRRVKASRPEVPVIMLTGTGGEEVAVEAMKEGVDDYILKNQLRFGRLPRAVAAALDRARQRAELARAERRYGDLFRSVPVGLCRCAPDGLILEANPMLAALLGLPVGRGSGLHLPTLFEGGEDPWQAALEGGAPEVRLQRPDGGIAWTVLRVRQISGDGERVVECALTDITDSKRAADERAALLGELYHRVNNTLQMLIGMVTAQAARVGDPGLKGVLRELAGRIHAVSLVQQRLYETGTFTEVEFGDFLRDLAASLTSGPDIRTRMELSPLPMTVAQAIPLGLAANEVLTNALKHAFPAGRAGNIPGEIIVRVARQDGTAATLEIADNGVGMPPPPSRREGYGTRLLRTLARQVGAEMEVSSAPDAGTRVVFRFPLRRGE